VGLSSQQRNQLRWLSYLPGVAIRYANAMACSLRWSDMAKRLSQQHRDPPRTIRAHLLRHAPDRGDEVYDQPAARETAVFIRRL